jgi:hypothetical protein
MRRGAQRASGPPPALSSERLVLLLGHIQQRRRGMPQPTRCRSGRSGCFVSRVLRSPAWTCGPCPGCPENPNLRSRQGLPIREAQRIRSIGVTGTNVGFANRVYPAGTFRWPAKVPSGLLAVVSRPLFPSSRPARTVAPRGGRCPTVRSGMRHRVPHRCRPVAARLLPTRRSVIQPAASCWLSHEHPLWTTRRALFSVKD